MAITSLTVKKVDADTYAIEMADEPGVLSILVKVPKRHRDRIYTEAERERLARLSAQELALTFAEIVLEERSSYDS